MLIEGLMALAKAKIMMDRRELPNVDGDAVREKSHA